MPSIAQSSIDLDTPALPPTTAPIIAAPVSSLVTPLRSTLPVAEVLDTVTSSASQQLGVASPVTPVWKPLPIISQPTSTSTSTSVATGQNSNPAPGVPAEIYDVLAVQTPYKNAAGVLGSLVTVSFATWAGDKYFAGVEVWLTGYNGISKPQLVAQGRSSPVQFLCNATKENVTVTVVAFGPTGLTCPFASAPTASVTLSGTVNPPPAPTIAQAVTALGSGVGWQFAWNALGGIIADEIDGYWVYKSSTNTLPAPPASRYQYFKQPATNLGTMTFSDYATTTEYYWVSAVSTTGMESTLSPANAVVVTTSFYPTAVAGTFSSPSAAYDGNETTSAGAHENVYLAGTTVYSDTETWSAFPGSVFSATVVTLKVLLELDAVYTSYTGPPATAAADVQYSLDGGSTWTVLTSVSNSTITKQYFSVSLPTTQDMTKVQVKADSSATEAATWTPPPVGGPYPTNTASMTAAIYEIRVEITHS